MSTVREKIIDPLTLFWAKISTVLVRKANIVDNCASTSTEYPLSANQGTQLQTQIDELNSNLGKIYTCTLTPAHAPQKTTCFGSMELPTGTYILTGSAQHSKQGNVCKIGIGTSEVAMPTSNGQDIYGNAAYDVNIGSVTRIEKINQNTIFYFQTWADSDFEIIPVCFVAIQIA